MSAIPLVVEPEGIELYAQLAVEADVARHSRARLFLPNVNDIPEQVISRYGDSIEEVRSVLSIPMYGELARNVVFVEGDFSAEYPLNPHSMGENEVLRQIRDDYVGDYVSGNRGQGTLLVTTAFTSAYTAEEAAMLLGREVDIPLNVFYGSFPIPGEPKEDILLNSSNGTIIIARDGVAEALAVDLRFALDLEGKLLVADEILIHSPILL